MFLKVEGGSIVGGKITTFPAAVRIGEPGRSSNLSYHGCLYN
jgi:hypothetical protein